MSKRTTTQTVAATPSGTVRPPNGPSTTGKPSGKGRGNNPSKGK